MTRGMDDTPYDVAVVGYGPTGATLANLFGLLGLEVVVFEREADIYPLPRAVHFDDEVMRVFQSVGIADELAELVIVNPGMRFIDREDRVVLDWPRPQEITSNGWHASYRVHQPDLEARLRAAATRLTNVHTLSSCPIEELHQVDDRVHIRARDRATNEVVETTARFVVGCDGARSPTRQAMGAELLDLGFEQRWLVVDVILNRPMPELGRHTIQYCDPEFPATYCCNVGSRRRWEFALRSDEGDEATDPEAVWQRLTRWITPADAVLERQAIYTFRSAVADRWQSGRLAIAGDAAHLTPPFMGQGMCAGIRDAANLSWKLARTLGHSQEGDLLDTYESERRENVGLYIAKAVELGGLINAVAVDGEVPPGSTMRSIESRLTSEASDDDPLRGTLLPQITLASGARFDDEVGLRTCVITGTPMELHDDENVVALCAAEHPELAAKMTQLGVAAAVVRPDKYVAASFAADPSREQILNQAFR